MLVELHTGGSDLRYGQSNLDVDTVAFGAKVVHGTSTLLYNGTSWRRR